MTREQFFAELEECLQGAVSAYELSDSLSYYRQYIDEEMRKGKSEEEIFAGLGSPRLIARSIIDARGLEGNAAQEDPGKEEDGANWNGNHFGTDEKDDMYAPKSDRKKFLQDAAKSVLRIVVTIAVLLLIFFLMQFLLPVALLILAVFFVIRWIRG